MYVHDDWVLQLQQKVQPQGNLAVALELVSTVGDQTDGGLNPMRYPVNLWLHI